MINSLRDKLDPTRLVLLGLGLLFLLLPLLPGSFPLVVGTEILILGLFALSFNLILRLYGADFFWSRGFFWFGCLHVRINLETDY